MRNRGWVGGQQAPQKSPPSEQLRPRVRQRTFALNFTVPLWPGRIVPGNSHRTTTEPTSLSPTEKFAARSDTAEPGTYSRRALRLSLTTTSLTSFEPVFAYLMVIVTTSPGSFGPGGSTL